MQLKQYSLVVLVNQLALDGGERGGGEFAVTHETKHSVTVSRCKRRSPVKDCNRGSVLTFVQSSASMSVVKFLSYIIEHRKETTCYT